MFEIVFAFHLDIYPIFKIVIRNAEEEHEIMQIKVLFSRR